MFKYSISMEGKSGKCFLEVLWFILYEFMLVYENQPLKMIFFCVKEFFFINFDFENECKNELRDNNEKSCSWSRNKVSHKIDFKAVCPWNGHAANLGVKEKCHQMVKKISEGWGLNLFLTTSADSIGKSMTRNFHFKNKI